MSQEEFTDPGDLSQLNVGGSKDISDYLLQRLESDQPYTAINSSVLVSLNPGKALGCYNDEYSQQYMEVGYKNFDDSFEPLPPHIYGLATRAYLHLRRMGQDQSFVFCGSTNSGKSENYKLVLNQLCQLAMNPKKPSKIDEQLNNLNTVLESFGNAATIHNKNSSRYGKFQEVQFNARGRIIGIKTLTYYLEKPRVYNVPTGERNFNVFYQLLYGASSDERDRLSLALQPSLQNFNYLINSNPNLVASHDDKVNFGYLMEAMKGVGLKSKARSKIVQLIATILHLGNLNFSKATGQDTSVILNPDLLHIVAELLGVRSDELETALTSRTQLVGKELCTVFLDVPQSNSLRDTLASTLYSLMFSWIVEAMNSKFCEDEPANFIAMLDQFGFQSFQTNYFEQFCINFANEKVHHYALDQLISPNKGFRYELVSDDVELPNQGPVQFKSAALLLAGEDGDSGIVKAINRHCNKPESRRGDDKFLTSLRSFATNPDFTMDPNNTNNFTINHYVTKVEYAMDDFVVMNLDGIPPDLVTLFRNSDGTANSLNPFVAELFSSDAVAIRAHPNNQQTIVSAQQPTTPMRQPSRKHKKKPSQNEEANVPTVLSQLNTTLNDLFATLDSTKVWTIININTFDRLTPTGIPEYNLDLIGYQVEAFSLPILMDHLGLDLSNSFTFEEFIERYELVAKSMNLDALRPPKQQVESFATISGWLSGSEYVLGTTKIFLSESRWKDLEDSLRASIRDLKSSPNQDTLNLPLPGGIRDDDNDSLYSGVGGPSAGSGGRFGNTVESVYVDNSNNAATARGFPTSGYGHYGENDQLESQQQSEKSGSGYEMQSVKNLPATKSEKKPQAIQEVKLTSARKAWVRITWMLTWMIPTFCISKCGMTRPDVQMAWREKVAICILIVWSWIIVLFVNIGLGLILCFPTPSHPYDALVKFQSKDEVVAYMYGVEYDLTDFAKKFHGVSTFYPTGIARDTILEELGKSVDVTDMFPKPIYRVCQSISDPKARIPMNKTEDGGENVFSFTHKSGILQQSITDKSHEDDWIFTTINKMNSLYKRGIVTYNETLLVELNKNTKNQAFGVINDKVYNLEPYKRFINDKFLRLDNNEPKEFLPNNILEKFTNMSPKDTSVDYTKWFKELNISANDKKNILKCMDELFYVGILDFTQQPRCKVTNILLIVSSCIILAVTLVKFIAALQLGGKRTPMDYDKFVICQVPAYTEGEDSIRRTLESLALTEYDDKHKLLFVIADGMLIGSGNDKPTPRIVCDVLGVDPDLDPEPFAFQSVAEGSKQYNMGKVFSGLYECEGRQVPYIIVAKVGSPKEKSRPGNRGKRDSQIVLMNFLNRVHFDSPMAPLELEIYHQLKNVIGVDPKLYEYILMVDADTDVLPDSLTRLVAVMTRDANIMGLCGETKLANENQSISTMIQVYEYYISHHLAKAFESLFGSVTCLPGCFSIYRVRTVSGKPLLITNNIIEDYSVNVVDTLHKKNLLHLGEDRYLTTLMLKNFPQFKMKFTSDACCRTVAPDRFEVLLSQRRRWINSTIHNLFELVFLEEMCGFCCFSMRFVVMLDLVGTIILPSTVIYLVYIICAASLKFQTISNDAILLMCSSYMLQALIFIIKQQWQHIGWMIFYLLGIPFFSFYLPIYSYWHFDDFSWGNTRVVVGDGVKQVITDDDEGFDPDSIPLMKFSEYEQRMWETQSHSSHPDNLPLASQIAGGSQLYVGNNFNSYGRASPSPSQMYSRSQSPAPGYYNGGSRNNLQSQYMGQPPAGMQGNQFYPPPPPSQPHPYMDPRASSYSHIPQQQGYPQPQQGYPPQQGYQPPHSPSPNQQNFYRKQ